MTVVREYNHGGPPSSTAVYFAKSCHQVKLDDERAETVVWLTDREATKAPSGNACRSRPECFASTWTEATFVISICLSQVFDEYMTSGFFALMPLLIDKFQLSDTLVTWSATITPLVISAFLLPFGRLADMYGGFPVFVAGLAWASAWTVLAGCTTDPVIFVTCRAMQGFGAAAHLPAGLAMLGKLYQAGPRKNMVFSVYGAMAPFGSFVGMFVANIVSRYNLWSEFFYVGAGVALLALAAIVLMEPATGVRSGDQTTRMDWVGSVGSATSLTTLVYSIVEAAKAKQTRRTANVVVSGALALTSFIVTAVVEWRYVCQPLVPASVFRINYMRPLLLGLLLTYGAVNIFACYATLQ